MHLIPSLRKMVWNHLWFLMGVWATTLYYHIWYDHIWWRHSNYHVWTDIVELFNFIEVGVLTLIINFWLSILWTTKQKRKDVLKQRNLTDKVEYTKCNIPLYFEFTFGVGNVWILSFDLKRYCRFIRANGMLSKRENTYKIDKSTKVNVIHRISKWQLRSFNANAICDF